MEEVTYQGLTFEPYIRREEIAKQVHRLAQEIKRDYANENVLFLCVLNGSFIFAADLFRACDLQDAEITFIRFKSYEGMESTGAVKQIMIIDSGVTAVQLRKELDKGKPKSVKMVSLLYKPEALTVGKAPEYYGFAIPNKFILGYGLDLDGLARNLPDIYVLKDK